MDHADTTPPRKRYRKPELREYGDLRRVTETVQAGMGAVDGAMFGKADFKTAG